MFVQRIFGEQTNNETSSVLFPVHGAVRRGGCKLLPSAADGLQTLQGNRLDRSARPASSTIKFWKDAALIPNEYSGFAFGIGIERIAMLKIRHQQYQAAV